MPAKDKFHDSVKRALIKDGWTITDDPLQIEYEERSFYIDLGAEKLFAAEKDNRKIAVEVKSFLALSMTYEFHAALGQFINYRMFLRRKQPDRVLFLAVSSDVYKTFFEKQIFVKDSIKENNVKIIVCDVQKEAIIEWNE